MKKTLIALLSLSGVAFSATVGEIDTTDATLKSYFNFDEGNTRTAGSLTWQERPVWNADGYGVSTATNAHPYTTGAGLKASTGFTVSFDINNAQNGTLLSMTTGNMSQAWRSLSITMTDGTVSAQFHGNTAGAVTYAIANPDVTWTTLTLVGSATGNTLALDFYVDGNYIGTNSTNNASNFVGEIINKMQFGYFGDSSKSAPTNIDNILVYNRALTADEVMALTVEPTTVPEPATATLSLLALAGLAVRRRRK